MNTEGGTEVISPMEFIPLLEETGLIIPAGRFILKEAAKTCCEIRQFIPGFQMNINVSYVQIAQGNVEDDIIDRTVSMPEIALRVSSRGNGVRK